MSGFYSFILNVVVQIFLNGGNRGRFNQYETTGSELKTCHEGEREGLESSVTYIQAGRGHWGIGPSTLRLAVGYHDQPHLAALAPPPECRVAAGTRTHRL